MNGQTCCCIPDQNKPSESCQKPAEWHIRHGDKPEDYTEACTEHVGQMLTDSDKHTIYPIHSPQHDPGHCAVCDVRR